MLHAKRGSGLWKEAMCYSRAKELIKKEFGKEGVDPTKVKSIACIQEELVQQQLLVFQTGSSRDMEVGEVRRLGTIHTVHTYIRLFHIPKGLFSEICYKYQ